MLNKELIKEILLQIYNATQTIMQRFEPINDVNDFLDDSNGLEKLDAICMQLIAIGESLKNIDKNTNGELLVKYSDVDWKGAKGMRDVITHHYFDLDAEAVYEVCKNKIRPLSETIQKIIKDL